MEYQEARFGSFSLHQETKLFLFHQSVSETSGSWLLWRGEGWLGSLLVVPILLSQLNSTRARAGAQTDVAAVQLVKHTDSKYTFCLLWSRSCTHSTKRAKNSRVYTYLVINQEIEKKCPEVKCFCSHLWMLY